MNKRNVTKRKTRGRRLSWVPGSPAVKSGSRPYSTTAASPYQPTAVGISAHGEQVDVTMPSAKSKLQTASSMQRAGVNKATPAAKIHTALADDYSRPSGKRVGGKAPPRSKKKGFGTTVLPLGFAKRIVENVSHHYLPTKGLIEDASSGAETFSLAPFIVRHHGNSRKLKMYKKLYPNTNFLLNTVSQTVGGSVAGQAGQKFPMTSAAGFARTGIFNPFGYHDAVVNSSNSSQPLYEQNLTWGMSHYHRGDFDSIIDTMIKKSGLDQLGSISNHSDLMRAIMPYTDGTTRFSLPITEMKTEYALTAKSKFMCTHVIIYMCTPKKPLQKMYDPLWQFFRPFSQKISSSSPAADKSLANRHLPDKMIYKPQVQSNPQVAVSGSQSTSWTSNLWDNAPYISTLATEVVPEAALEDSRAFREDWRVLHKYRICLQPQQTVKFEVISQINTMTDLFKVLGYDPDDLTTGGQVGLGLSMWPGETVFPVIRFWGDESTATSVGLRRVERPAGDADTPSQQGGPLPMEEFMANRNKVMDQTELGSVSCQLNLTMKKHAAGHFPNLPVNSDLANALTGARNPQGNPISYAFMDCVQQSNKNFFPYNDKERGQTSCYHRVNTNVFDFVDADAGALTPYSGKQIPTVMELDTENEGVQTGVNWTMPNIELGSTNDINNVEIEVVTNKVAQETGSTV